MDADVANGHPCRKECSVNACVVCGIRDCVFDDYMHYGADGCPSCGFEEAHCLRPDDRHGPLQRTQQELQTRKK